MPDLEVRTEENRLDNRSLWSVCLFYVLPLLRRWFHVAKDATMTESVFYSNLNHSLFLVAGVVT